MRENDTKVIASMRRESPVYKGFQRFSALEVIRFLRCSAIFRLMEARPTGRGVKPFDTPENSQKEKCESL